MDHKHECYSDNKTSRRKHRRKSLWPWVRQRHDPSKKKKINETWSKFKTFALQKTPLGDFPGGPVVKTPHFHCTGRGFDPWPGN